MKKIYTTLFLSCWFALAMAQPTITTNEIPTAGTAWTTANDTLYITSMLPGGANQTWDYSGLMNYFIDTVGFGASAGTPYASNYPASNLASYDQASGSWSYFTSNSTGLYFDGLVDPTLGTVNLTPALLYVPVPFTYGNTRTSTSGFQIDTLFGTTNARINFDLQSQFEADGYGTVILPNGTHNNVLRVKITNLNTTTVSAEIIPGSGIYTPVNTSTSQSTDYRFFEAGAAISFILDIQADSLGTTTESSAYLYQSGPTAVTSVVNNNSIMPYPNPSSGSVVLPYVEIPFSALEVVGMDGRRYSVSAYPTSQGVRLDVSSLVNGMYHFTCGNRSGRFTVQH